MIVFENDLYIVHFQQGNSTFVLVTFTGIRSPEQAAGSFFSAKPAEALGLTCVGVVAKADCWYRHPCFDQALAAIRGCTSGFSEVYLYGASMGAYAALKYARALRATQVLALAPQWSLDPQERPGRRTLFDPYFKDYMAGMGVRPADVSGTAYLIFDPNDPDDALHADQVLTRIPSVHTVPVHHAGHIVAERLKGTANLASMLSGLQSPESFRAAVSRIRRANADHRRSIVAKAIARHPEVAFRRLDRAAGLDDHRVREAPDLLRQVILTALGVGHVRLARAALAAGLYGSADSSRPSGAEHAVLVAYAGELVTYDPHTRSFHTSVDFRFKPGFHEVGIRPADGRWELGYFGTDDHFRSIEGYESSVPTVSGNGRCRLQSTSGWICSTQPNGEIHCNRQVEGPWEVFHALPAT